MVVLRGLKSLWNNMTDYAKSYYDAMNEIRIVTMMSEEEAEKLGASYRQLAAEMSVSSKEIAEAAVEYWRQGLGSNEVEERLKATITYAKISSLEFAEAAELMTAATNSLGLSADKVADVWAYLGDASASGADEIGKAMQKVSAVANQAGIQFEWLGAYIATLSEKTRQAPEQIGTALNAMISRLQQIKQKGFNSEDIYGINDIAKALGALEKPIALMDEVTGEWRNWPDILNDIATQWQNLTDKEQAYIATTMGGTRQRNYLLTLLNDLSKATEDGSRAWELYNGALESSGLAMEKYAIYEESVEAAQGRLTAATEEFYSILGGDMLKGFYNTLAAIINIFNDGTSATNGWNIALGLIAAAFVLLNGVVRAATIEIAKAGGAAAVTSKFLASIGIGATAAGAGVKILNVALASTIAGAVIAGVVALAGAMLSLGNNAEETAEHVAELNKSISDKQGAASDAWQSVRDVKDLAKSYSGAESDIAAFKSKRQEIINQYPDLKNVLTHEVNDVSDLTEAYDETTRALTRYANAQTKQAWSEAHSGIAAYRETLQSGLSAYDPKYNEGTLAYVRTYANRGQLFESATPTSAHLSQAKTSISGLMEYQDYVTSYIDQMRKYLDANADTATEEMYNILASWEYVLYNQIMPQLDDGIKKADEQIISGVKGIVTDALNVYQNSDILEEIPRLQDILMSEDWTSDAGRRDEEAIRARVEEVIDIYRTTLQYAQDKIAEYSNDPSVLGDVPEQIIQTLINTMREGLMSDEQIAEMLTPLFEQLGKTKEALLEQMGLTETSTGGSDGNFDEKLERAFEYLDRIEDLRNAVAELSESGVLTSSIVDSIKNAFGEDGEDVFKALMDSAINSLDEFDFGMFMDALRAKLEEEELGAENLLAMFGLNEDSEAAVQAAIEKLAEAADADKLAEVWATIPQKTKEAMGEAGQEIETFLNYVADEGEDAATKIENALKRIERATQLNSLIKTGSVWSDLDDIVDDLTSTTENAVKAISDMQEKLNDAGTAAGALDAAMAGDQSALEYLANLTGLTAEQLANNLTPAELMVAEMGDQASLSMEYLANMLYTLNAIQLDASGKIAPIESLEAAANNCGMTVAALANVVAMFNGANITWTRTADGLGLRARASVPKITWTGGSGGTKKSSGGGGSGKKSGGGGGGGSGSNDVSELVKTLVDEFTNVNELRDHRRELAQLGQSYHEARGEIQGVIAYLEIERDVLKDTTDGVEVYLRQLEEQIEANRAVVSTEAETSKAYKQAMIDLDKLQEEHQKYSKELIQNQTDLEKLTQAIKEQYNKIRQMEIDLENEVLQAIEDREAAQERMLDGRITMEEEIMDLLRKRYEAERDEILETQDARKNALNDELNQIDELLAARKKLAEQEDKMAEIAKLESQIARITADPTRQKEALQLQQKLAKLREEVAWDAAEEEAKAQKDSIKKQIQNIDDYIDYIKNYYDELLNNPKRLIEEMQEILSWTDEQIIEWLKKNNEEFEKSTESARIKMVNGWQSSLDDMRDTIRTHWAEVQTIIEGGADNIINFLTTYTQKYREASAKQAEAYVDEWKKQLEDLEAAHRQVQASISSYDYVQTKDVSGGSGGGGSGGGGTGSGVTATTVQTPKKTYYQYEYRDRNGKWITSTKNVIEASAFDGAKKYALKYWQGVGGSLAQQVIPRIAAATFANPGDYLRKGATLYAYKAGGMSTNTGLAWLDGTKARPERILSAYQTELFEDMINTLHTIRRVNTGGVNIAPKLMGAGMLPNIETINITVQSIDNNTDIEDAAEKLMTAYYEKIARTRPVGGIQGW